MMSTSWEAVLSESRASVASVASVESVESVESVASVSEASVESVQSFASASRASVASYSAEMAESTAAAPEATGSAISYDPETDDIPSSAIQAINSLTLRMVRIRSFSIIFEKFRLMSPIS